MIQLNDHDIHIWRIHLPDFFAEQASLMAILNEAELQRAMRFHFAIHRERFIVARAMLRKMLSLYMALSPEKIELTLGERGKPSLAKNPHDLHFNLSHSHDVAIYAFTTQSELGIDIEKIEAIYQEKVAKRFFSAAEYSALADLSPAQQAAAFYQIWVKKEAVIKALGQGLYAETADFSVHWDKKQEAIQSAESAPIIHLYQLNAVPGFASALATLKTSPVIRQWEWSTNGYVEIK